MHTTSAAHVPQVAHASQIKSFTKFCCLQLSPGKLHSDLMENTKTAKPQKANHKFLWVAKTRPTASALRKRQKRVHGTKTTSPGTPTQTWRNPISVADLSSQNPHFQETIWKQPPVAGARRDNHTCSVRQAVACISLFCLMGWKCSTSGGAQRLLRFKKKITRNSALKKMFKQKLLLPCNYKVLRNNVTVKIQLILREPSSVSSFIFYQ